MPTDPYDSELSDAEARALSALRHAAAPPPGLYGVVSHALRDRGAFRVRRSPWLIGVGAAAAVTLAFVAGLAVRSPATAGAEGREFVLLLLNAPPATQPVGKSDAEIVEEYRAWASSLSKAGRLVAADELAPQRFLVDSTGTREGALADGANGFFVVRASDAAAALALAKTLPYVRHGGVVSVQPVMVR